MYELARSRPTSTNELFDAATNYAAGEEAVGAILDGKVNKRKEDVPAEGSSAKTNAPAKKQKRGKKGKKPAPPNQRRPGQAEDSDEAFVPAPDRKGPRGPPSRRWRPVRRHAQEAVPLPHGLGQPHP